MGFPKMTQNQYFMQILSLNWMETSLFELFDFPGEIVNWVGCGEEPLQGVLVKMTAFKK